MVSRAGSGPPGTAPASPAAVSTSASLHQPPGPAGLVRLGGLPQPPQQQALRGQLGGGARAPRTGPPARPPPRARRSCPGRPPRWRPTRRTGTASPGAPHARRAPPCRRSARRCRCRWPGPTSGRGRRWRPPRPAAARPVTALAAAAADAPPNAEISQEPTLIGEVTLTTRSMFRKRSGRPRSATRATPDRPIAPDRADLRRPGQLVVAGRLREPGQHRRGAGQPAEEQVAGHLPGAPDRLLDDRLAVVGVRLGPRHHELLAAAPAAAPLPTGRRPSGPAHQAADRHAGRRSRSCWPRPCTPNRSRAQVMGAGPGAARRPGRRPAGPPPRRPRAATSGAGPAW